MEQANNPEYPNLKGEMDHRVTGRTVFFGEPGSNNYSWGIELDVPIDENLRKYFNSEDKGKIKMEIPDKVTNIRILDLKPEESIPSGQRIIGRTNEYQSALLDTLARKDPETDLDEESFPIPFRSGRLFVLMRSILRSHVDNTEIFNKVLNNSKGSSILIITGHGGGSDWHVGEATGDRPINQYGETFGSIGNSIRLVSVLDKYDDIDKYAAILITACNPQGVKLKSKKVPIFYPKSSVYAIGYAPEIATTAKENLFKKLFSLLDRKKEESNSVEKIDSKGEAF